MYLKGLRVSVKPSVLIGFNPASGFHVFESPYRVKARGFVTSRFNPASGFHVFESEFLQDNVDKYTSFNPASGFHVFESFPEDAS